MRSAHRAMDRLFEQFVGENAPTYYLPVDVFESDQAYTLVAPVPGFKQDQVETTFEEGILPSRQRPGSKSAPNSTAAW